MVLTLSVVVACVLVAWLGFFYFVRHWPLRVVQHGVFCPVQRTHARISLVHSQVSFGSYMPIDIQSCSLFPQGPVTCDKQCMK